MKKVKRRIIGAALVLGLISGTAIIPAHAEWKSSNGNWIYTNIDGTLKTGWINDKNSWYYLMENGILDNYKTATTMPDEIKKVYDMVNSLVQNNNLKFITMYHTQNNDCFMKKGIEETTMYQFRISDDHNIPIADYYYNPQSGKVYKSVQGEVSEMGTPKDIFYKFPKITQDMAAQNFKNYLIANKIEISNVKIQISDGYGNAFIIKRIENNGGQVNVVGKYYADKTTGNIVNAVIG